MITQPIDPRVNLVADLATLLINVLLITFITSAIGPLQWWTVGTDGRSEGIFTGRWELVGLIGLVLLE